MKKRLSIISLLLASVPAHATELHSPDGRAVLDVNVDGGTPMYSLSYDGQPIIISSPLGFKADIGDFASGLSQTGESVDRFSVDFSQRNIKHSRVRFDANRLVLDFSGSDSRRFSIEWLLGDNDLAFRYVIPRQGETGSAVITEEATAFRFPGFTTTFITSQSDPMVGWKRSKPSYEEYYTADAPMSKPSEYGRGYTFPALFHIGDNGWALVSETGVDGGYCASRLGEFVNGGYRIEYPMPGENNGNGSSSPGIALPGATPWRTVTFGKTLAPIVETVIPWAPLEPLYDARSVDGKGTWSWIVWQDGSMNYDDQVKFIDLAADMGYGHILIDAGWDVAIGRERMADLVKYAKSKGVKPAVWYSSSGWWNDIVQSPTNIMSRPIPRKREMKWLRSLGAEVIKVDFFGGDKQETMRLYEDILSDAADYGLSVIFHGCTVPRGWERLYPNYVGSEAVLASENLIFSQDFCDKEAFHAALHPFVRNAIGSMEYGGTILNRRMSKNNEGGNVRRTSDAFQLATSVLFQNAVQNFGLTPEAYREAPADAIDFMRQVPTTWDETRFVDGYPGRYAVIARRHGDIWYIAGVSNLDEPSDINLELPMLPAGGTVTVWRDEPGKPLRKENVSVNKSGSLKVKLFPGHGFVIRSVN